MKKTDPASSKKVFVGFRITEEFRRSIDHWLADHRGDSLQALAERGIALAMGETQTKAAKNAPKKRGTNVTEPVYNLRNPEYRDWVDFVIDVFNSGNKKNIDGLISNIENFKLGPEVSKLATIAADLLQVLKKQEVSPDASITAAIAETTDLARTLARARDNIKHLQAREKTPGQTGTKRTG